MTNAKRSFLLPNNTLPESRPPILGKNKNLLLRKKNSSKKNKVHGAPDEQPDCWLLLCNVNFQNPATS